jgi:hypothetical protein
MPLKYFAQAMHGCPQSRSDHPHRVKSYAYKPLQQYAELRISWDGNIL